MIASDDYKPGTRFQLLVSGDGLQDIVYDWFDTNQECDLRIRKAKTPHCAVVETTSVMYANRILRYHPGIKVNIVPPTPLYHG